MNRLLIVFAAGALLFSAGVASPRLAEANNAPEISVIAPERIVLGGPPQRIIIKIFDPDAKDQVVRFKIIPSVGLRVIRAFRPGNEVSVIFEFSPKMGAPYRFKVFAWDKSGELTKEEFTIEVEKPEGGSPAAGSGGKKGGPSLKSLQAFANPEGGGGGGGSSEIDTPTTGGGEGGGGSFREGLNKRLSDMKLPERKPKESAPVSSGGELPPISSGGVAPEVAENIPPDVNVQAPGKVIFGQAPQKVVIKAFDRDSKDKIVSIQVFPSTGLKVTKAFKPGNPATVEYTYTAPRKISIAFKVIAKDSRGALGEQEFTIEAEGAPPPASAANNAPSITIQKPDSLLVGGAPATIIITAYDPDKGDAVMQLEISPVTGLSGGSARRVGNRLIKTYSFRPTRAGSYDYVVFARDKKGELTRESFNISVGLKPNDAPRIVANDSYDVALSKKLICVDPRNVSREVMCGGMIRFYSCKPVARRVTIPIQVLDDAADTISVQFACPVGSRGTSVNTRQRGRVGVNAVCEFRNFGSYRSTIIATDNRGARTTKGVSFSITPGNYTQAVTANAPSSCVRNP